MNKIFKNLNVDIETPAGCAIAIICIAIIIGCIFFMPLVCIWGWTPIALGFNLPQFTYWEWFFISWMIRYLFKGWSNNT